jgi:intein/homing endonuclease
MKNFLKDKSAQEVNKILGDAWLNLVFDETTLYNPLLDIPSICRETPHLYITWLMTRPEYISFICQEFLNIRLLPFQCVILQEMWQRKFPMLVATRGGGKSFLLAVYCILRALLLPGRQIIVVGAGFRQSKMIYDYVAKIWNNAPLLRDAVGSNNGPKGGVDAVYFYLNESKATFIPVGCLHPDSLITTDSGIKTIKDLKDNFNEVYGKNEFKKVGFFYDSGISPALEVKTNSGYSYIGTPNHKMKVVRDQKIEWVRTDEIKVGDNILIDRSERWFNSTFTCTNDEAYCLGLMLGDGNYTHKDRLRYTTIDKEFLDVLNKTIGEFKPESDGLHYNFCGRQKRLDWLDFWGLESLKSYQKTLPETILSSSKENVAACISGLFDTDGHVYSDDSKGGMAVSVNLTTTSETLAKQVQYILLHFGIISSLRVRKDRKSPRTGDDTRDCYELGIYGKDVILFKDKINFKLSRKRIKLEESLSAKTKNISSKDIIPVNISGCKHVTNRKTLTFDKYLKHKEYFDDYFKDSLELFDTNIFYDKVISVETKLDQQMYDINVPKDNLYCANGFYSHNTGETIRGYRSNDTLADEFKSHNKEIFENVIAGFGAVSSDPHEKVAEEAKRSLSDFLKIDYIEPRDGFISNQIVISGTAYYYFNHFAEYWEKWRKIINSKGDPAKIKEIFEDKVPEDFYWKDYSVIRLPYDILPKGFMDSGNIARSKATLHSSLFQMEFGAIFSKDSEGFFKASLLESATANIHNDIQKESGNGKSIVFHPRLSGDPNLKYYMGVDTASQVDNFAISILEIHPDHRRIVYSWTTNAKDFKEKRKSGDTTGETDFFRYCIRKIRELMKRFNIERISIDAQGGGRTIYEGLHDKNALEPGEQMLWEIMDDNARKDTDSEEGLHIIELVNFAKQEYTGNANHGMKKDFEEKNLLFPEYSPALLATYSSIKDKFFEEMEDVINDIEELKNELTKIVVTVTANGRERFDTPEIKISGSTKGRDRKDRYSALLMANMLARIDHDINNNYSMRSLESISQLSNVRNDVKFVGPAWIAQKLTNLYD